MCARVVPVEPRAFGIVSDGGVTRGRVERRSVTSGLKIGPPQQRRRFVEARGVMGVRQASLSPGLALWPFLPFRFSLFFDFVFLFAFLVFCWCSCLSPLPVFCYCVQAHTLALTYKHIHARKDTRTHTQTSCMQENTHTCTERKRERRHPHKAKRTHTGKHAHTKCLHRPPCHVTTGLAHDRPRSRSCLLLTNPFGEWRKKKSKKISKAK